MCALLVSRWRGQGVVSVCHTREGWYPENFMNYLSWVSSLRPCDHFIRVSFPRRLESSYSKRWQLHRGVTERIMPEMLWRLARRGDRQPNCLRRRRVFGFSVASLAPQSRTLSEGMPRCNCHLAQYKIATRPEGPLATTAISSDFLDTGLRRYDSYCGIVYSQRMANGKNIETNCSCTAINFIRASIPLPSFQPGRRG